MTVNSKIKKKKRQKFHKLPPRLIMSESSRAVQISNNKSNKNSSFLFKLSGETSQHWQQYIH